MATYNLLQCKFWTNKDVPTPQGEKQFAYYFLTLEGIEPDRAIDALWKTSPSTPEPTAGPIEGTVEKTDRGWKFTKGKGELRKPDYEAAVPSKPNTGRDSFRKHPAEVAGARRAHAQHMALMELAIVSRRADFDFRALDDDTFIRTKIDWWDMDARDASEKAERED